jgi:hypothetical protein
MSRETVKRSDMAGHAGHGYCASHSRFYWGLKLHLIRDDQILLADKGFSGKDFKKSPNRWPCAHRVACRSRWRR